MQFSSLIFIYLFLPVTFLTYFIVRKNLQNTILLLASLVFYAWGGPSLASVLAGSILINYFSGILIGRSRSKRVRRTWLIAGLVLNLVPLVIFKYTSFFVDNINVFLTLFGEEQILMKKIVLPLGISFFTFKAITYLVSVFRGETGVQRNIIDLALFISLFPEIMAGPISRYRDLAPGLDPSGRKVNVESFASGINRFVLGLAKKILIANPLANVADMIFGFSPDQMNTPLAWLGIICFTLQIYYDFSGYSDIAIGLGRMFGFRFVENFDFPYLSRSLREFWRRWHISLSTWFRDYIFLPIAYSVSRDFKKDKYGGIRSDKLIYLIGTSVTFLLCGFWHGPTWNFILWGMLHGTLLIIEQAGFGRVLKKTHPFFQHLYLIFFLTISFVFFRTETLQDSMAYLGIMFGLNGIPTDWNWVSGFFTANLILPGIISIAGCSKLFSKAVHLLTMDSGSPRNALQKVAFYAGNAGNIIFILLILFLVTVLMTAGTIDPFVYFRF